MAARSGPVVPECVSDVAEKDLWQEVTVFPRYRVV